MDGNVLWKVEEGGSAELARDMGNLIPLANQRDLVVNARACNTGSDTIDATIPLVTCEWLRCDAGDKRQRKRSAPNVVKYLRKKKGTKPSKPSKPGMDISKYLVSSTW